MARNAGLDVPRIVQAALAVADRDGIDKLTMRRLSAELGVTPMAAYHHVTGKDELLDLVIDESLGQLALPDPGADAQQAIVEWFVGLHELLLEHPALAAAVAGRRIDGPQAARAGVALAKAAQQACGDPDRASEMVTTAFWLTLGSGQHRAARNSDAGRADAPTVEAGGAMDDPDDDRLRRRMLATYGDNDLFRRSLTLLVAGYLAPS